MSVTQTEFEKGIVAANAMKTEGLSGFNRLDSTSLGIIQFCYSASSGEVHQIDEDMTYTLLTSQTTFADGVTPLADRTVAAYHSTTEDDFSYWYQGEKITVTGIKTLQIADNGGGYVYFNSDGELELASSSFSAIVLNTLLVYLQWNTTENEFHYFADERHGITMDPITHIYNHETKGFAFASGSDITGLANNGTTFTAVEAGIFSDEDIEHVIDEVSTAPFIYREGADGQWRMSSASNALGYLPSGNDLKWNNEDSGGTGIWGLDTMVSNNDYVVYTFWQTNNALAPVVRTVGQKYFGSRSAARNELSYAVNKLKLDGLPSPEMTPIGSMILHTIASGQIEQGSDGEVWIDHRFVSPTGRF